MAEIVQDSNPITLNSVLSILQKNAEQLEMMRKHLKETSRIIGELNIPPFGGDQSDASAEGS